MEQTFKKENYSVVLLNSEKSSIVDGAKLIYMDFLPYVGWSVQKKSIKNMM